MKKDVETTTNAFKNLFSKEEILNAESNELRFEDDTDTIFKHLQFAETIFPQGGIMLCPVSHARFRYVGINCEQIFGHPYKDLKKMLLNDFFALVHPDDLQAVRQCLNHIKTLQPFDPATHRFVMRYRIRNWKGEYLHIQDEKIAVKTADNTFLNMIIFTNLTSDKKFYHVTLDVLKLMNGKYIKTSSYNPKQKENAITPRQNDIARLILKGFTNQEIADHLCVSIFTVKNHKKMLFKKVNVRNSIQLANYVRQTSR
jgi:DNA-binding CsgD family transcriptional regulator